jgi:hypothetical protein
MKLFRRMPVFLSAGLGAFAFLFLLTTWFQIQSVRWGYKVQALRHELDNLEKKEQNIDQRLQGALSLARLDELARTKFGLQVPGPAQIILLSET